METWLSGWRFRQGIRVALPSRQKPVRKLGCRRPWLYWAASRATGRSSWWRERPAPPFQSFPNASQTEQDHWRRWVRGGREQWGLQGRCQRPSTKYSHTLEQCAQLGLILPPWPTAMTISNVETFLAVTSEKESVLDVWSVKARDAGNHSTLHNYPTAHSTDLPSPQRP